MTSRRALLSLALCLAAAFEIGAGVSASPSPDAVSAPPGGAARGQENPFEGVRFERPRTGPGGEALHALGQCIERDDLACVDRVFHGGEMVVRRARAALEDGSIAIERPGLVEYYRKRAAAGGEQRYRDILMNPLRECQVSLLSASRGRCDDTGWVDAPPSPVDGADPAYGSLLEDLWEDLGGGLGERRARRLVCGMLRMGTRVIAEEAIVVLAPREDGGFALVDVRCEDIETGPRAGAREKAEPVAEPPPWPPADPDDLAALTALGGALECIAGGGAQCFAARAPLPGVLVRDMKRRLPERSAASARQEVIDNARSYAANPGARAGRLRRLAPTQCSVLQGLASSRHCTVESHTPGAPAIPDSVTGVSAGELSQMRAAAALLWGRYLGADVMTSRVTCPWPFTTPSGKDRVTLDVVWTRGDRELAVLVDVLCGVGGPM